jgi:hypothetical protein
MVFAREPAAPNVERLRLELVARYVAAGAITKALTVADKVKNRQELVRVLLQADADKVKSLQGYGGVIQQSRGGFAYADQELVLVYVDRELDRIEQRGETSGATGDFHFDGVVESSGLTITMQGRSGLVKEEPLTPIPAGKKAPKDDCGKEWAMTPTNFYGLFPSGWEQESAHVPSYIVNETGRQLRDRLARAFVENDLASMKELCQSFIRLDDIPLSSPWFDTSGGRLQGRIKYTLNQKAKPVVSLLREIAGVAAESKKEFAELAQKSLKRIDAITHPKTE